MHGLEWLPTSCRWQPASVITSRFHYARARRELQWVSALWRARRTAHGPGRSWDADKGRGSRPPCGPKASLSSAAPAQCQPAPGFTQDAHPDRGEGAWPARARGCRCAWARSRLPCSVRSTSGLSLAMSGGRRGVRVSRVMGRECGQRGSAGAVAPGWTGAILRLGALGWPAQEGPGMTRSIASPRPGLGSRGSRSPSRAAGVRFGGESDHGQLLELPRESRGKNGLTLGTSPHPVCRTARPSGVGRLLHIHSGRPRLSTHLELA